MRTLATLLRAPSEAYDGLAAEAALVKAVEDLARTVEVHRGADARGDRPSASMRAISRSPSGVKEGFAPGVQTEPLARIPDGVTDQQVAALPVAGITALGALQLLGAAADQHLVIMGATGGVGGYAVQMAHARGAHVIATVRGDADEARRLGAEEVYDAKAGEVIDALRASHPDGVDAILDLVNRTQSAVTPRFSNAPAASSRRFMRRTKGGSPSAKSRRTISRPARILL